MPGKTIESIQRVFVFKISGTEGAGQLIGKIKAHLSKYCRISIFTHLVRLPHRGTTELAVTRGWQDDRSGGIQIRNNPLQIKIVLLCLKKHATNPPKALIR